MDDNTITKRGFGFSQLLGLLFIGLRLGNVIDWPWVWVLSPIWIPFGILLIVLIVVTVIEYGKRIPCLFKGHDYQGGMEAYSYFPYCATYVVKCTKCGKEK